MKNQLINLLSNLPMIIFAILFTSICCDAGYSITKTIFYICVLWGCIIARDEVNNLRKRKN